MAKTISQKVVFKNTTPKALYDLFMNSKKHTMIAGAPAKISSKVGGAISTYGGYFTGQNIHLEKDKLIVQSLRAQSWDQKDPDSTFIISLEQKGKNVILNAIHANVPDKHEAGLAKGWNEHYWNPWKQHLAGKKITRPQM